MSLNIKDERVHELAKLAAQQSGMSITRAVGQALEQFVAAADQKRLIETEAVTERIARVNRVLRRLDAEITETDRSQWQQYLDDLYDDRGLPA